MSPAFSIWFRLSLCPCLLKVDDGPPEDGSDHRHPWSALRPNWGWVGGREGESLGNESWETFSLWSPVGWEQGEGSLGGGGAGHPEQRLRERGSWEWI